MFFFGNANQVCPIIGMGNINQGKGSFPGSPPSHGGDSIFGYDEIQGFPVGKLVGITVH